MRKDKMCVIFSQFECRFVTLLCPLHYVVTFVLQIRINHGVCFHLLIDWLVLIVDKTRPLQLTTMVNVTINQPVLDELRQDRSLLSIEAGVIYIR